MNGVYASLLKAAPGEVRRAERLEMFDEIEEWVGFSPSIHTTTTTFYQCASTRLFCVLKPFTTSRKHVF